MDQDLIQDLQDQDLIQDLQDQDLIIHAIMAMEIILMAIILIITSQVMPTLPSQDVIDIHAIQDSMEITPITTILVMVTILILIILLTMEVMMDHTILHTTEVMMDHTILHTMEVMMDHTILLIMAVKEDLITEVKIRKIKVKRNTDSFKDSVASSIMDHPRELKKAINNKTLAKKDTDKDSTTEEDKIKKMVMKKDQDTTEEDKAKKMVMKKNPDTTEEDKAKKMVMKKNPDTTEEDKVKKMVMKKNPDTTEEDKAKKMVMNKNPDTTEEDKNKIAKKMKDSFRKLDHSSDMDHLMVLKKVTSNKILVNKVPKSTEVAKESIREEEKANIMEAKANITVAKVNNMEVETSLLISQLQSTGEPKVLLLQLRTKDNVVHAGLSQPLDLLRVPTS